MDGKTFFLWIATIFFWGITPIIEKAGLKNLNPLTGLFLRTAGALVALTLTLMISSFEDIKNLTLKDALILLLSGITGGFLGMYFYFKILKHHPASQIVPLTSTYPLVTIFMAFLLLKEPLSFNKILGTLFIIMGIILLFRNT